MTCPECVRCTECGQSAYCLAETGWGRIPPCPHWPHYCEVCRLEACEDCQESAELVGGEPTC